MPTELRLGIPRFSYPDLFNPGRLKDLSRAFDTELAAANPELFASWDAYRKNPGQAKTPVEISALLVGVAEHVSRFVVRLFGVADEAAELAKATADQDPVFRFKVDFVRRRVLPALKKIVVPADAAGRAALDAKVAALRDPAIADVELATALVASKLLDAGKQPPPD